MFLFSYREHGITRVTCNYEWDHPSDYKDYKDYMSFATKALGLRVCRELFFCEMICRGFLSRWAVVGAAVSRGGQPRRRLYCRARLLGAMFLLGLSVWGPPVYCLNSMFEPLGASCSACPQEGFRERTADKGLPAAWTDCGRKSLRTSRRAGGLPGLE